MKLKDKVAIITGAASGIGKAAAVAFSNEGSRVCIIDIDEENGESVLSEIKEQGGNAIFISADVAKSDDVKSSVDQCFVEFGSIDILINNAAVAIKKNIIELEEHEWDRIINVNLKSMYLYSHLVIPNMIRNGGGVVLNLSSITGLVAVNDLPAYCASKAGVIGLTRAMALDHAGQGVRVNCICPSGIKTAQMEWYFQQAEDPEKERQRVIDLHPVGRMADSSEVANLLVYLSTDEASFITGAVHTIDGGYTIF